MLDRVRSVLLEWELLGVGILLVGILALVGYAEHQTNAVPRRTLPAPTVNVTPVISAWGLVYGVDQVLANWQRHPKQWVGRAILVRAQSFSSCVVAGPPWNDTTTPCLEFPINDDPTTMLYDPRTRAEIPTLFTPSAPGSPMDPVAGSHMIGPTTWSIGPPAVFRVTFTTRQDCGPLGKDQHPCLLGLGPQFVGS
jgi:hypothetical protein